MTGAKNKGICFQSYYFFCFEDNFHFMTEILKSSISQFCVSSTEVLDTSYSSPEGKGLQIYYWL